MNHKKDKISVFVSVVSTKIPFKGTGKEYIAAAVTPVKTAGQPPFYSSPIRPSINSFCIPLHFAFLAKNL